MIKSLVICNMYCRKYLLSSINFQHKFQNASSSSSNSGSWRNYSVSRPKFHKFTCDFPPHVKIHNTIAVNRFKPLQENAAYFSNSDSTRQYSTQNLFRLTETSASQLQPYLDISNIIKIQEAIQDSINRRQLTRQQVKEVKTLFNQAQAYQRKKENALQLKEANTAKYQALNRSENKDEHTEKLLELKEQGRCLRDEVRAAENKFNEVNDSLVDFVLSLPNVLDRETPATEAQLLKEVAPKVNLGYDDPEYTAVETQCGPGLLAEFPIGKTAWLDIDLRGKAQAHLLSGGFVETGNAEYVKRLILQGAGIDEKQFLRIREPNVKKGWEHATYLAGGASFPSFLALFAQSIIEEPKILPIRYFVIGRSYESQKTKPGFYQSHVVQAFVACRSEEEMEKEFQNLQKK
ncbi:Serine--tRNA ligase [Orchesella cincta]|uniref:Serine--tRNA ligase n=1 Tax=Orchesella cincta TaxID=48709 RepID=A0A1D2N9F1_ORCCI|nr:Serine--tRNA ligase [Orchesella cincta]